MSAQTIKDIMSRVRTATPDSQIAVFRFQSVNRLDVAFANSVNVANRIANNDKDLIGVYDCTMNQYEISHELVSNLGVF